MALGEDHIHHLLQEPTILRYAHPSVPGRPQVTCFSFEVRRYSCHWPGAVRSRILALTLLARARVAGWEKVLNLAPHRCCAPVAPRATQSNRQAPDPGHASCCSGAAVSNAVPVGFQISGSGQRVTTYARCPQTSDLGSAWSPAKRRCNTAPNKAETMQMRRHCTPSVELGAGWKRLPGHHRVPNLGDDTTRAGLASRLRWGLPGRTRDTRLSLSRWPHSTSATSPTSRPTLGEGRSARSTPLPRYPTALLFATS